jgi:hypothetical protein
MVPSSSNGCWHSRRSWAPPRIWSGMLSRPKLNAWLPACSAADSNLSHRRSCDSCISSGVRGFPRTACLQCRLNAEGIWSSCWRHTATRCAGRKWLGALAGPCATQAATNVRKAGFRLRDASKGTIEHHASCSDLSPSPTSIRSTTMCGTSLLLARSRRPAERCWKASTMTRTNAGANGCAASGSDEDDSYGVVVVMQLAAASPDPRSQPRPDPRRRGKPPAIVRCRRGAAGPRVRGHAADAEPPAAGASAAAPAGAAAFRVAARPDAGALSA